MAKTKNTATIEEMQGEINALQQLLANSDYQATKHSEGMISDDDYAETKAARQGWRDRINQIKFEMQQLEKA